MWRACRILLFHLMAVAEAQYYSVPEAKLQAFTPRGFRVSIPDSPGVQLFAFHGNVNLPLDDLDAGQMSRDILRVQNGRWVFEDRNLTLKRGDVINYWIFVQVDGLGYTRTDQHWIVSTLEEDNNELPQQASFPSDRYSVPEATLEALQPKGLRVSIPDSPGVQLFAFHGNANKPLQHLEAGTMSKDILKPKNGRWVFEDPYIRLKNGDVINYWLYVKVDGIGYRRDHQAWTVSGLTGSDSPKDPVSGSANRPEMNQTEHHAATATPQGSSGTQADAGYFPQVDFNFPEGMELLVVVTDGKLLLKRPLPPELTVHSDQTAVPGYCKATRLCLPVYVKT